MNTSMDIPGLKDRAFVLFGAGRGIGLATAKLFVEAGAKVLCVDRDAGIAEETARESGAVAWQADALDRASVEAAFEEAANRFGGVDGVVDIIGMSASKPLLSISDAEWASQFEIVLKHAYVVLQSGMKAVARGGSFTFIGSLAGSQVITQQSAYGSAKAALHHLVRFAAVEFGEKGVRVNAVAPGFVKTPRLLERLSSDQWAAIERVVPLGRVARPLDVAGPLLFLASDLASIVTGQVLSADGGVGVMSAYPDLDSIR